jgi:molecular chaperone GrpE
MNKGMRKQEKPLTELEPLEIAAGTDAGEPAEASQNVPAAEGDVPVVGAETVSRAEFDQVKTERDQLIDRIARLQAEFDNARKRAERERVEFRDYATGSVVEQFLPVLDNFELALKADGSADQMRSGVP